MLQRYVFSALTVFLFAAGTVVLSVQCVSGSDVPESMLSGPGTDRFELTKWYLNPQKGTLVFSFRLPSENSLQLTVFDLTGNEVFRKDIGLWSAGTHQHEVDLGTLTGGIYYIELRSGQVKEVKRMVVGQ